MKKVLLAVWFLGVVLGSGGEEQQALQQQQIQKQLTEEEVIEALSQGMNSEGKRNVGYAVGRVGPSKWIPEFIQTVNALSVGMNSFEKSGVIRCVANVDPSNYPAFIQTVNALSVGMGGRDKSGVIESVAKIDPSNYGTFIQIVNTLSVRMDGPDKSRVIKSVAKINPSNYARFIEIVNALSQRMSRQDKSWIIFALSNINPEWYDPFVRYAQLRNFFGRVPVLEFGESLWRASLRVGDLDTFEQFQALVSGLLRDYNAGGAQESDWSVAQDVHHYANQIVKDTSGNTKKLKDAIVERISILSKDLPIQAFEVSAALMRRTLPDAMFASENAVRARHPLPPITGEMVVWALDRVAEDATYVAVFNQVVAYVQSVGALEVWAKHFILNSVTAYDATSKGKSCPMGVRERILTSLMFVKNLDPAIEALFEQSESADTMNKLVSNWGHVISVEDLKQAGIRSDMTAEEAKPLYEGLAKDRVKEVTGIDVDQSVDSESKAIRQLVDTVRLSVADFNERFETVFKAGLQALESGSASPAEEVDTAFAAHAAAPAPRVSVGHVVQMLSMGMAPEQKAEVKRIVEGLPQGVDPMVFRQRVNEQTREMSPDQRLEVMRRVAQDISATPAAPR